MASILEDRAVLLVDDDNAMRRLVRELLRDLGCQDIDEARNGKEAIASLSSRPFDVLIFGWPMEPINGLQLTRLVRRTQGNPNQDAPIIMLTGHLEQERVLAARDAGASIIIAKPLSRKTLAEKIAYALKNPVLHRAAN